MSCVFLNARAGWLRWAGGEADRGNCENICKSTSKSKSRINNKRRGLRMTRRRER